MMSLENRDKSAGVEALKRVQETARILNLLSVLSDLAVSFLTESYGYAFFFEIDKELREWLILRELKMLTEIEVGKRVQDTGNVVRLLSEELGTLKQPAGRTYLRNFSLYDGNDVVAIEQIAHELHGAVEMLAHNREKRRLLAPEAESLLVQYLAAHQ